MSTENILIAAAVCVSPLLLFGLAVLVGHGLRSASRHYRAPEELQGTPGALTEDSVTAQRTDDVLAEVDAAVTDLREKTRLLEAEMAKVRR